MIDNSVIGEFKIRDSHEGTYALFSVVASPYESEKDGADRFNRRLDKFDFGDIPFSFDGLQIVDDMSVWLFDFKQDNTVSVRRDWDQVDLQCDETDPDSIRQMVFTKGAEEYHFNWYTPIAKYMRTVYPSSYVRS